MERIFLNIKGQDFAIEYSFDGEWIEGDCYPVDRYNDIFMYCNKIDGSGTKKIAEARCYFGFVFSWRGVWDSRIYFKDDEYWSMEIEIIKNLWEVLETFLKNTIKEKFPGDYYDD